jgi:hypothetical protein
VIRIEPTPTKFLEAKPAKIRCKVPPVETYFELVNIIYLKPEVTYKTIYYNLICHIVASGAWMYLDFNASTEIKIYHIVKTTSDHYYLMEMAEKDKYLALAN